MTTWSDDNGARLDTAIDEAARQMTDGAPGGGFKARVIARLGERESFSAGRRLAWMAPIAAAIILVLMIGGRFGDRSGRRTSIPATQPQSVQTVRPQPPPTAAASAAQSQTRQTPTSVRLQPDTTYATDGGLQRPGGTGAPRVARSEVDALAPATLAVESIHLEALPPADSIRLPALETIEPIDVAPLATLDIEDPQRREP